MIKWAGGAFLVLVLVVAAWWYTSQRDQEYIRQEFVLHVVDTAKVKEIEILNRDGNTIKLTHDGRFWLVNGERARGHAVHNLLATLHDQRVSALIPKAALENVVRDLGSNSVRIQVKDRRGGSILTFYVGGVTPDERGTFMLREGSEWPVIVNIPGFEGGLRSRYIMPLREWKSRQIIQPVNRIKSLTLDYPARQEHSLLLQESGDEYQVRPFYQPNVEPMPVHPYLVEAYQDQLNHLYAEALLDGSKRQALKAATPFCRLTLEDGEGKVQMVEFYPTTWIDYVEEGERPQRVVRYYTVYNDHDIFLTQHLLMQKIFTGYEHFVSLRDFGK